MSDEITQEEIAIRYNRAHYQGYLNQQGDSGGKTVAEAQSSFKSNDEKAAKYLDKFASLHDTIAAHAKELAAK